MRRRNQQGEATMKRKICGAAAGLRRVLSCQREGPWEAILFVCGAAVLASGFAAMSYAQGGAPLGSYTGAQFDDTLIRNAVGNLFMLVEGAFGALIMVVSGIGAIVAAAMGAYRAAVGMIVVAVGSFILRSLVSLFFGAEFTSYEN